ncbi:MAG TPA: hypothetical protein VN114_04710 [Oxalicibacterium sp.]|nr:hypothetical protein [Oxalicibacterium sp.]HWU97795.1 hypothetical protein [Oxalicibacterium sp.]
MLITDPPHEKSPGELSASRPDDRISVSLNHSAQKTACNIIDF